MMFECESKTQNLQIIFTLLRFIAEGIDIKITQRIIKPPQGHLHFLFHSLSGALSWPLKGKKLPLSLLLNLLKK